MKVKELKDKLIGTCFATPTRVDELNQRLLDAFKKGARDDILAIISEGDFRRLPYF